jgi:TM2 domain-containing membrane protein YozV
MKRYWLSVGDGQTYGPYTVEELRAMSAQGRLNGSSMVCEEGAQQWTAASAVLFAGEGAPPPPPPNAPPVQPSPFAQAAYPSGSMAAQNPNAKSKIAAGLFGILLGWLGVHNFYLGYIGKGVAQLLITVLSCGWLWPASWIWGLIEGIMILSGTTKTDAQGVPLRD